MEMRMVGIEQCFIEASVEPLTPLAVKRSRKEMTDCREPSVLYDRDRGKAGRGGQQRCERGGRCWMVKVGYPTDQFARGYGEPDAGLSGQCLED